METAYILGTRINIPHDKESRVLYTWEGNKHCQVFISIDYLIQDGIIFEPVIGAKFRMGSYPLKIIEIDEWRNQLICLRTDTRFGIKASWYVFLRKISPFLNKMWWRIIATAKIWGIVKENSGTGE